MGSENEVTAAWKSQSDALAARFGVVLEAAPDAMVITNPDGLMVLVNRNAERMFGHARGGMVGAPLDALIPDRARMRHAEHHREFFAHPRRRPMSRCSRLGGRRRDGSTFDVDIALTPIETPEGSFVVAAIRDTSEREEIVRRQEAENEARRAQERLARVVASSPAVLYSIRVEAAAFSLDWISDNVERLLGYTAEEALGPDWWVERLHHEDRARVLAEVGQIRERDLVQHEYRFRRRDGAYRWMRAEIRLLRDAAGEPVEAVGSWTDVTSNKEAEIRQRESAQRYRLLFESNPHPMYVFADGTLAFLAVNDAAVQHYGFSREEFLRMTLPDIRRPEELPALLAGIARARAATETGKLLGTFEHLRKDGSLVQMEIAATAIDFEGRPAWLVLAADVTEKRALEAQLLHAQKMEAVGHLAGGIAHDFNNLLGVITGYTELLIRELAAGSRARRRAEEIQRAADRAAALTRQLLAFGRRQVLRPSLLDLNAVVADVEKMLGRLISESIQIRVNPGPGLGMVRADAGQLEQVLLNLAVNARDAMPSGGRLLIETWNADLDAAYARQHPEVPAGRYVGISVSDTGHGMDARTMARIFEPFFTTKAEGKGTGLGLSTVYGIVRQSGGTVEVESRTGEGSTFRVYLPRVDEKPAREAQAACAAPAGGTERVLVVEDAPSLRSLIHELLDSAGYSVSEAAAPDTALALLASENPAVDVVLTDLVMPGMTGQEFAARLRAAHPSVAVVFMSGYSEQAAAAGAFLDPGTPFLQKPFTLDSLLRAVRAAVDAKKGNPCPASC